MTPSGCLGRVTDPSYGRPTPPEAARRSVVADGRGSLRAVADFLCRTESTGRLFSSQRSTMATNHGGNSGLSDAERCGARRPAAASSPSPNRRETATRPCHLVQDAAEAEEVGAAVERFAAGLLRRHVLRRAGDDAESRDRDVVGRSGQAEVGEDGAFDAFFEQDVRRLDVAMDEALLVRRRQTGRGLHADAQDFREFQRAPGRQRFGQRFCRRQAA